MRSYRSVLALIFTFLLAVSSAYLTAASAAAVSYLPLAATSSLSPIINPKTIVLPPTTTAQLQSIDANGVMTFKQSTPELAKVRPGFIVVSEPSVAAPYGFLRRVNSVSTNADGIILQT